MGLDLTDVGLAESYSFDVIVLSAQDILHGVPVSC